MSVRSGMQMAVDGLEEMVQSIRDGERPMVNDPDAGPRPTTEGEAAMVVTGYGQLLAALKNGLKNYDDMIAGENLDSTQPPTD